VLFKMNYKFLKVTTYYPSFLSYFYNKNPNLHFKSFEDQLKLLLDESFSWGNFFQVNLNKLGNDAYEIIYNADPLQNTWAKENNLRRRSRDEIFLQQLKIIKPDILFLQDISSFHSEFINKIREEAPSIKLVVGWLCAPYTEENKRSLAACDFVFSCSEHFLAQLKSAGIKCYRLNHAFELSLLRQIEEKNNYSNNDFLFVGSFFPGSELHDMRVKIIEKLLAEKINIKIYSQIQKIQNIFVKQRAYAFYQLLKRYNLGDIYHVFPAAKRVTQYKEFPNDFKFSDRFNVALDNTPLFGIEMLKAFSKAKIVFNSHGGVAGDFACNIRLFEATGAGACLITDHKKNIADFFIPNEEIVIYKTIDECVEKVKWLLNHPTEMRQIAEAGHQRTLRDHTFYNRSVELDSIIKRELSS